MVDAIARLPLAGPDRSALAAKRVNVVAAGNLDSYADLCRRGIHGPAQSAAWIEAWVAHHRPDYLVATLYDEGVPAMALALEIVSSGPFRIARFMGGSHANGNFPALDTQGRKLDAGDVGAIVTEIRKSRPDIDLLSLERLAMAQDGEPNPLRALPHSPSVDLALTADLTGGFEKFLERMNGKKKRKKNRMRVRKFDAAGGYRCFEASTPAEADRLLKAFFELKEKRFRAKGIRDVFAAPEIRAFFQELFVAGVEQPRPRFALHGLEVGGSIRAVSGLSRCGGRLICEFGAIANDDLAYVSPGEFLYFEIIRKAAEEGVKVYDFSVGDEPYKRSWCDNEVRHFDVVLPLTIKGSVLATGVRGQTALKSFVKRNAFVWDLVKKLRQSTAARATPPAED